MQLLDQWLDEHPGARLRLLGVRVAAADRRPTQLDLFTAPQSGVDDAVDAVRQRFGNLALRAASSLE